MIPSGDEVVIELTEDEARRLSERVDALQEWVSEQMAEGESAESCFAAILFYGRCIYEAQRGVVN